MLGKLLNRNKKKQLILNCEKLETRVALLNEGRLEEYMLERKDDGVSAGSLYLGKIVNLELSLQAAFVDIGEDKNAFLPFRDMLPTTYDIVENIRKKKHQKKALQVKRRNIRRETTAHC
jgi:ribonuclease G